MKPVIKSLDTPTSEETMETVAQKAFEAPSFSEDTSLQFPEEVWEEYGEGNWCFGCSNCNCN